MNKIYAGLHIIAKYDENFELYAEHDELFLLCNINIMPTALSEVDCKAMDELGWRWDGQMWKHYV